MDAGLVSREGGLTFVVDRGGIERWQRQLDRILPAAFRHTKLRCTSQENNVQLIITC
jgi:hypothetical protein